MTAELIASRLAKERWRKQLRQKLKDVNRVLDLAILCRRSMPPQSIKKLKLHRDDIRRKIGLKVDEDLRKNPYPSNGVSNSLTQAIP